MTAPTAKTAESPQAPGRVALPGPLRRLLIHCVFATRDFVYPPLCTICDNPLSKQDAWLCEECLDKLQINAASSNACPLCGQNRSRHTCACALAWDHPYERLFAMFDFDDTVRAVAHHVKYQGRKSLAFHLGRRFAGLVPAEFTAGADAMTAVPLHYLRRMHRGYNQAEHFGRGVCAGLGGSIPFVNNILRRTRHTRTQTKLDREERERNLRGAFAVNLRHSEGLRGRHLILVDDVVTTGATTGACTRALLAAGAASVRVLALARD